MSSQLYSIEYLCETAIQNLLKTAVGIPIDQLRTSDDASAKTRPCLSIVTTSCREMQLGVMANGDYNSGVYEWIGTLTLEQKGKRTGTEEASQLWQQVWQALHWDDALNVRLNASQPNPFYCHFAMVGNSSEDVNAQLMIWRKSVTIRLIAMGRANA